MEFVKNDIVPSRDVMHQNIGVFGSCFRASVLGKWKRTFFLVLLPNIKWYFSSVKNVYKINIQQKNWYV